MRLSASWQSINSLNDNQPFTSSTINSEPSPIRLTG